ncbi:MAG: hypothetical protein KAV87_17495 [Desulfobacteraceae bacterium]|nr:hypothetical protein [Desulfobacteraceae bacterium]
MSDLLSTTDGTNALIIAQRYLLERRLSRFFKRNLVISYNEWLSGDGFHLETLLGELNAVNDPEVINLYRLLGLVGGLAATISPMDIYVDPAAGSDETGDGSEAKPFASLWFYESLPKKIRHEINIMFVSDFVVDGSDSFLVDFDFDEGGYLNFVGVGVPEVVESLTVLTTGLLTGNFASYIQMTTPPGAEHAGEFIFATSGTDAGKAQAIHSRYSTDTFLVIGDTFSSLDPADTMDVVRPAVSFQCTGLSVACRNSSLFVSFIRRNGKVAFVNLQLDITNPNDVEDALLVDNTVPMSFSFCQINPPDNGTWRIKSEVNTQSCSTLAEERSQSGVENISILGTAANQRIAGMSIKDTGKDFQGYVDQGSIRWLSSRGVINLTKKATVDTVSCERMVSRLAVSEILNTLVEGRANSGVGGGLEAYNSLHDINGLIVLNSDNILSLISQATITVQNIGRAATYSTITGYGVYFESTGFIELRDAAGSLTGTTGDIRYECVSPGVTDVIPAAFGMSIQQSAVVKRLGI